MKELRTREKIPLMDGGENAGLKDPRTEQRTDSERMPGTQSKERNKERTPSRCPEHRTKPASSRYRNKR